MPVNNEQVLSIASMLTDDPSILQEMDLAAQSPLAAIGQPAAPPLAPPLKKKRYGSYEGTITDDDVQIGDDYYGTVEFNYTYNINGKYYPATYESPAEYPEIEIISVEPHILQALDEFGTQVPETPEMIAAAEEYFWKYKERSAIDDASQSDHETGGDEDYNYDDRYN